MNDYQLQTFSNGLRVVTIPLPHVKSVTVMAMVKAGSRLETPQTNGISHFLEHMVFKGTRKYPTALKLATAVDAIGAEFNAFTGKEETTYYVKAAENQIEKALKVVYELVFQPLIPAKELEIERGVILEEIRMYEDQPMWKVGIVFESLIYRQTPLGWQILGKPENIRSLSQQDFWDYRQKLYHPHQMVLGLAGSATALKSQKVKPWLAKLSQVDGVKKLTTKLRDLTFSQTKPAVQVETKKTEQAHLCLGVRTFKRSHPRRYALAVLSALLGGGMSSRLFTEIREKRGLAYYVRSGVQAYADNGYLMMQAGTEPKNTVEVVKVALEEFSKIARGEFKDQELKKVREYIKGQFILSLEDSKDLAGLYVEDILHEDKPRTPGMILKAIEAVTKTQVQALAAKIFVKRSLNFAAISPKGKEEELEKVLRF